MHFFGRLGLSIEVESRLRLNNHATGIYCGPLRLLAWEVAQRLNKANVPCELITGQEREEIDGAKHKAVTVEMSDVNSDYSCAVVDEIQVCLWSKSDIIFSLITSDSKIFVHTR